MKELLSTSPFAELFEDFIAYIHEKNMVQKSSTGEYVYTPNGNAAPASKSDEYAKNIAPAPSQTLPLQVQKVKTPFNQAFIILFGDQIANNITNPQP